MPLGSESEEESDGFNNYAYRNKSYWALPENVRHAIDISKKKSKHSEFYNKMTALNEKISVYKMIFYAAAPNYEN